MRRQLVRLKVDGIAKLGVKLLLQGPHLAGDFFNLSFLFFNRQRSGLGIRFQPLQCFWLRQEDKRASDTVLHFLVLVNQLQLHLHVGEVLVLLLLLLKLLSEPGQPRIEFGKCVDSLLVLPQDLGLVLLIWRQLNKNGWVSRCYMQCAWQLVSSPYHLHRGCSDRVVFRVKRVVKAALDQKKKKCSLWYRVRVCLNCTLFL